MIDPGRSRWERWLSLVRAPQSPRSFRDGLVWSPVRHLHWRRTSATCESSAGARGEVASLAKSKPG